MNRDGTFLVHLVECLNTHFVWERSVRLCRGALLDRRFLLTVARDAFPGDAAETILSMCRRLAMPDAALAAAHGFVPAASFVHFGFEENETSCLYKVYLEFDQKNAQPGVPFLLHLAFKWDTADGSRHVQTQYLLHAGLSLPGMLGRLADIYRDSRGPESFAIVEGVLQLAVARGHVANYLEVTEALNERRSFDLNLYDAQLQVQDLYPFLAEMCGHFSISLSQFQAVYEPIKTCRFGHLAGGVHRGGQDFFNLYFGAERRQGKTTAGFGQPNSVPSPAGWPLSPSRLEPPPTRKSATVLTPRECFEMTTDQDQYYNYCWWPYMPVAPTQNKFRPVNLLYQSFDLAGLDERAYQLVHTIRDALGPFRTVYGVKWVGTRLAWEFYFYDYQRREREVSITRVLNAIRSIMRCEVPVNESLPYFMFSLDVNGPLVSGARDLDVVHMYIGNPGSRVSSGIAYALTAQATTLENFYFFFEAKRDLRLAAEKIFCSAHVDAARIDVDRILRPELRDCNTICVANKQGCDTAYFSGVNVDQLLFFLKLLNYPPETVGFVEENHGKLDHLLYDVGFDYVTRGDEVVMVKSGYYGVF
jgi:hypothetical protein